MAKKDKVVDFETESDESELAPSTEVVKLSAAEWERRTKLDVSNPEYINPSLDHGK